MQSTCRSAISVLTIGLLPNISMSIASLFIFMNRPLIHVEYFLVAVCFVILPRMLAFSIMIALFAVDLFVSLAPGFYFELSGLVDALSGIGFLDLSATVLPLAPAVIGLIFSLLLIHYLEKRITKDRFSGTIQTSMSLLVILLVFSADYFLSPNNSNRTTQSFTKINIGGSISTILLRSYDASQSEYPLEFDSIDSATSRLFSAISNGDDLPKHITLVLAESLSLYKDNSANALQLSPLADNAFIVENFNVEIGSVLFKGPTISGELRELCGIRFLATIPKPGSLPVSDCLPKKLAEQGYKSIAVNGFFPSFFSTGRLYSELGFEEQYFINDIATALTSPPLCGSTFRAVCDLDAARKLFTVKKANRDDKIFFYWLTFNGHLPIWEPEDVAPAIDCSASRATSKYDSICSSVRTNAFVMKILATKISEDAQRHSAYIIVGDHMAPFLRTDIRAELEAGKVPYIILTPKTDARH